MAKCVISGCILVSADFKHFHHHGKLSAALDSIASGENHYISLLSTGYLWTNLCLPFEPHLLLVLHTAFPLLPAPGPAFPVCTVLLYSGSCLLIHPDWVHALASLGLLLLFVLIISFSGKLWNLVKYKMLTQEVLCKCECDRCQYLPYSHIEKLPPHALAARL